MPGIAHRIESTLDRIGTGRLTLIVGAVAWAIFAIASNSDSPPKKPSAAPSSPSARDLCSAQRADRLATYRKEIEAGRPWEAANATRYCAVHLADAELHRLTQEAERADTLKTARNTNASTLSRLQAAERLIDTNDPEKSALQPLRDQLAAKLKQQDQQQAAVDAARRKTEGVSIGMTPDAVLASSWGKPTRINQRISAHGTGEQWVYPGGQYLYFDNGILTSISTSR